MIPKSFNSNPPRQRVTDSHWFWIYVFGMAGLAGLLLIGPKFSQRQARLESKQAGRESAWKQRVAEQAPADATPTGENSNSVVPDPSSPTTPPRVPLWPLATLLTLLMIVAWGALMKRRRNPAKAIP